MSEFYIQTYTGLKFDFLEPTKDMFCIEDIAHHLATLNRFSGAAKFPYSIGYHSILACKMAPEDVKLEALLHELEEPYTNDLSFPFKNLLKKFTHGNFEEVIDRIKYIGEKKFGLQYEDCKQIIKEIDCRLAITEEQQLMKNFGWLHGEKYEGLEPYSINIMERNWKNVEIEFLDLYNRYRRI